MAFTKINAAGIGTTERVTVDGLTVINNLSVGGTVSIAGTLTYEDVTNVDAVGLITARGGVFISAGSSIGIGSAAPTAPIDIHSSSNTLGIVSSTNNGANFDIFDNDTQSRIRTVDGRLHLYADFKNNTPDSAIRFFVDSSNEVARVSPSGVGIGTTNPVSLLTLGKSPNPSIRFKDYTNNAQAAITCGANGQLVFQTDIDNGVANSDFVFRADGATTTSEIIRFKNTGNVGIGTDNPDGNLHVFNSSAGSVTAATDANNLVLESAANVGMSFLTANDALARIKFGDPDATNAGIIVYSHDGDSMRFHTATTERLRISSDGRLLVNTTAARNVGGAVSRLIEVESSGGGAGISIVRNQNTASPGTLDLGKSRGYPHTIVQDDDKLGIVNFCGADGTDLQTSAAQIVAEVDGTPGENDMPGRLIFKTTADGSNSPTERLRITASGQLEFRNIDTAAETGAATQVNWIGPYVYQHSKTVTATTNGSGAVTFDLGCPFYYDGTTFEYFINASPTDNTNFTTTYQKGFFTKARGGGLGQFEVIKNDSAKAGCSLGTPTAGNPNGHQFNIAISGAVANKEYRATILYTGISRYAGYT